MRERRMERERENVVIENSKGIIVTKFIQLLLLASSWDATEYVRMRLGRFKSMVVKIGERDGVEREGREKDGGTKKDTGG